MKKLSLKKLKFEANDMLQRNELKTVFGGYDDSNPSGGNSGSLCVCTNGHGSKQYNNAAICQNSCTSFCATYLGFCQ